MKYTTVIIIFICTFRKSEKRLLRCLGQLEMKSGKEMTVKETLVQVVKVVSTSKVTLTA